MQKNIVPLTVLCAFLSTAAKDKLYRVNCCEVRDAPTWLRAQEISAIASDMERELPWSIRRIVLIFHHSDSAFAAASKLGFRANAFFSAKQQTIQFAPQKDLSSFTPTFRHELVHVIFNQKFHDAIPAWLEEGLANYIGSKRPVNYQWLSEQKLPDVTSLAHPSTDAGGSSLHYQLSTATAEMIATRCNLRDLLMLATGAKLANYLATYCKIKDVNIAARDWIKQKK